MSRLNPLFVVVVSFLAVVYSADKVFAVLIPFTDSTSGSDSSIQTTYAADPADLINQGQPTFNAAGSSVSSYTAGSTSTIGGLNDGLAGGVNELSSSTTWGADADPFTRTFALNTVTHPLGYNITMIRSIAAWQGAPRAAQSYDILYSTVDAPAVFLPLTTVSVAHPAGTHSATLFELTDSSGILASGVAAIQFVDLDDRTVWRELDVIGSAIVPPVPEPSSFLLLGLGLLATRLRARRRKMAAI